MRWILAAVVVLGFGTVVSGQDYAKMLKEAKYPLAEAVERALKEAKDGVAVQAEIEEENGKILYSVDVAQGAKIREIALDVKDGKVLEAGLEGEDQSAVVKAARITLAQAIRTALEKVPGTAVQVRIAMQGEKPAGEVAVFAEGKVTRVIIDAASGAVLRTVAAEGAGAQGKKAAEEKKGAKEAEEGEEGEEAEVGHEKGVKEAGEKEERAKEQDRQADTEGAAFTETFGEDDRDLGPTGTNPFFILEPGYQLVLQGREDGEEAVITITVLEETKKIAGVETRVVEERELVGGQVKEVTRDYFAISRRTNNVYYFGEDVDDYKDGKIAGHSGAWLAGENGCRYGLLMSAAPLLGARYYQEIAPGVAMDRAEVVSLSETFECPAGKFTGVLRTVESSALEKGKESKRYARGVGLLQDGDLTLVKYGKAAK